MSAEYFVIHVDDETGDVLIRHWDKKRLLQALEGNELGENPKFMDGTALHNYNWPNAWDPADALVIKGNILIPKPEKVVAWEV